MEDRWREHCWASARGSQFAFHCAIRKHGADCWETAVLSRAETHAEAKRREIDLIQKHNTRSHGYNMTAGGDGFRGLIRSAAHRAAISKAHTGRVISEETRAKLREYKGERASFFGRKQSPEWYAKMKALCRERSYENTRGDNSKTAKHWIIICPDGTEFCVKSLTNFCRTNNLLFSGMLRVAQGHCDTYKDYTCKYADETRAKIAAQTRTDRHARRADNWRLGGVKRINKGWKLNWDTVRQIRALYDDGNGYRFGFWSVVADRFEISDSAVRNVCLNKVWVEEREVA